MMSKIGFQLHQIDLSKSSTDNIKNGAAFQEHMSMKLRGPATGQDAPEESDTKGFEREQRPISDHIADDNDNITSADDDYTSAHAPDAEESFGLDDDNQHSVDDVVAQGDVGNTEKEYGNDGLEAKLEESESQLERVEMNNRLMKLKEDMEGNLNADLVQPFNQSEDAETFNEENEIEMENHHGLNSFNIEHSNFFNFNESISLPFGIDSEGESFAFSAWMYLFPSSDVMSLRVILDTNSMGCEKEIDMFAGGITLIAKENSPESYSLVLRYMTSQGCQYLETFEDAIPGQTWTHVGVSYAYNVTQKLKLYINGRAVFSIQYANDKHESSLLRTKRPSTMIGDNIEGVGKLEGLMTMLAVWERAVVDDDVMRDIFSMGLDMTMIANITTAGVNEFYHSPKYLYPFGKVENVTCVNEFMVLCSHSL